MIRGSSDVTDLDRLGMRFNFWKPWAINDSIGNVYGRSWRHAPNNGHSAFSDEVLESGELCPSDRVFNKEWIENSHQEVDQLANVIYTLKNYPKSSRHRISTYIPAWASNEKLSFSENLNKGKGVITPCACFLQFTVTGDNRLNLHITQASSDILIGLPVNVAQYALLTHLVARECGFKVGELLYTLNDTHIYLEQLVQINASGLLDRDEPDDNCTLEISGDKDIFHIGIEDLNVTGYAPNPFVPFEVAV